MIKTLISLGLIFARRDDEIPDETAEEIMARSRRRLTSFRESIEDQTKEVDDAMKRASQMYSGKELFDQTDRIFNQLIDQDSRRF